MSLELLPGWEARIDAGGALEPPERTPEGFMRVCAYVVKPGVLTYQGAGGKPWRELVTEETVRSGWATLIQKPVTLEHPPDALTPANVTEYSVGNVGENIELSQDGHLMVRLAVHADQAIQAIENGKREVSPGYFARLDFTPGVHPLYGEYDAVQVERQYNHVAVVDRARGGRSVRLRADSAGWVEEDTSNAEDASTRLPEPENLHTDHTGDSEKPRSFGMLKTAILLLLGKGGFSPKSDSDDDVAEALGQAIPMISFAPITGREVLEGELGKLKSEKAAIEVLNAQSATKIAELEARIAELEASIAALPTPAEMVAIAAGDVAAPPTMDAAKIAQASAYMKTRQEALAVLIPLANKHGIKADSMTVPALTDAVLAKENPAISNLEGASSLSMAFKIGLLKNAPVAAASPAPRNDSDPKPVSNGPAEVPFVERKDSETSADDDMPSASTSARSHLLGGRK